MRCSRPCRRGSTRIQVRCARPRESVEHPFGTMKMRMGATHFLCKTLPTVATEMALCVLIYNLTREMNIFGVEKIMEAITA
jgi:hypothetical protein